jgi:diamine N-acetyltransferase
MSDDTEAEPIYTLSGALVALGPLRREMIDLWLRWFNDLEMLRTLGSVDAATREAEERFYALATSDGQVNFAIFELASSRPVGTCGLREVNQRQGTATFGISIGDRGAWNRGYGTEATRLLLDYAFHWLGLHNVLLSVFANNPRGVRAYEKAGFRVIGHRREAHKLGQQRMDEIFMDALASEFDSPLLERQLYAPQQRPTS